MDQNIGLDQIGSVSFLNAKAKKAEGDNFISNSGKLKSTSRHSWWTSARDHDPPKSYDTDVNLCSCICTTEWSIEVLPVWDAASIHRTALYHKIFALLQSKSQQPSSSI